MATETDVAPVALDPPATDQPIPVARPATGMPGPPQGQWTYDDFLALPDDPTDFNRYEVIEGVLYESPSPAPRHQRRLFRLCSMLETFIRAGQLGELFIAPLDLVMPGATPVQPDAFFIARDNPAVIDDDQRVEGLPDLVIEVASPSTAGYDRREKQDAYARAGVPEYWIVDPVGVTIEPLRLEPEARRYQSLGVFAGRGRLPTVALKGLPYTVQE
ncbi:MAG: Uma2 family endonuclease, partial [Chloroflexota bacterium]